MDPVPCEHWRDAGKADSGVCALNYYGGRPSRGTCAACLAGGCNKPGNAPPAPSKGLGDTLAKAIHAATGGAAKPCQGCRKRQDLLNRLVPYHSSMPEPFSLPVQVTVPLPVLLVERLDAYVKYADSTRADVIGTALEQFLGTVSLSPPPSDPDSRSIEGR